MANFNIALAGNPNCGKTTLFNALTGARQKVGNWSGVTVERKEGKMTYNGVEMIVTDLPGTYSLSPYSIEEIVAREYIVDETPDVVINIVDASNIERNLYLTTQIMELGRPVVVALNMMDVAESRGMKIDAKKLSKDLGVAVVPIVASKGEGKEELLKAITEAAKNAKNFTPKEFNYGETIEEKIENILTEIDDVKIPSKYNKKWFGLKVLEEDEAVLKLIGRTPSEEEPEDFEDDMESIIADKRYDIITDIVKNSVKRPSVKTQTTSDKVDKILTNKWLGLPIFAGLMLLMFRLTFTVGSYFADVLDGFIGDTITPAAFGLMESIGAAEWLTSLVVDGIVGGVGGILTFVPNIAMLFLAITFLEDTGYMARVAFIMDRAMRKIGLNGKAFIPMLMGFGCNVPAIMGTRTLEDENDRLLSILINPFMSCQARMPVYALLAGVFFKGSEWIVTASLYFLGIFVAIIMGLIFKKTLFKGESAPFVMELPPYRVPTIKGTLMSVWERVKGYLIKAGTVILAISVILWFILGYNFSFEAVEMVDSIGASIGRAVAPIFSISGFGNWQASLSLISGIAAKEVVISNMAIIYGLGEAAGEAALEGAASGGFGTALGGAFTQLSAYAFMVFVLLYTPCAAVIGVVKRETNSWKWTIFSVVYQFAVALIVSALIFQVGSLLGF